MQRLGAKTQRDTVRTPTMCHVALRHEMFEHESGGPQRAKQPLPEGACRVGSIVDQSARSVLLHRRVVHGVRRSAAMHHLLQGQRIGRRERVLADM